MKETVDRAWAEDQVLRDDRRSPAKLRPTKLWVAVALAIAVVTIGWLAYSYRERDAAASIAPAPIPQVVVSKPLLREVGSRLGFLGQFSAVERVELRAQVGGTLTGIYFKDGDIVHKGDLLFAIDARPYEIRLAGANAQLERATAQLALAERELYRAGALKGMGYETAENVDKRTAEQKAALAAVDDAKSQIRDAQFDLEHCRITAPFTGRMGTHLVSVGNLIAGSRAATSPTTLLATIVSLDPIWLDFDMSESDFLAFSRDRARRKEDKEKPVDKVEIALSDETRFDRQGTLDFVDNALDRSSGTIHARATVPNPDLLLTPGEFGRVRLVLGAPMPCLLVTDAAVLPDQSEHIVMTVAPDGTVVPKRVEIGDLRGGLRVIRSGLTPDDQVIIDGIPHAAPGAKVSAQDSTIRYEAGEDQG